MEGIEKITGRILDDAKQQASALTAEANENAAAVKAQYDARAKREADAITARAQQEAEAIAKRGESLGALARKKDLLAVRQELIAQAFDRTMEALCAMPQDKTVDMLVKLAYPAVADGTESLIFNPADRASIGKTVVRQLNECLAKDGRTAALTLDAETRTIRGGLYVRRGQVETNCTYEALLREKREAEAGAVAGILFA